MNSQQLRFGVFLGPHHPLNETPTLALERDLQLIELLDHLDFDEAWVGEHHSGGFEIISAPEIFIAAAAERTKYIRLGTGVKSLPFYDQFFVADELVKLVEVIPISPAFSFIMSAKLASEPAIPSAKATHASFPEAIIMPLSRSSTVT